MNISACSWEVILPNKHPMDFPRIERVGQMKGDDKFAARLGGSCLNKNGEWEYEPIPSSRDDDFMERCRFDTFKEVASRLEDIYT